MLLFSPAQEKDSRKKNTFCRYTGYAANRRIRGITGQISLHNLADNNQGVLKYLFKGIKGKCFGDKGYMTALFEEFYQQGLHLITKVRANMKNKLLPLEDKLKLRKRAVVESVNDSLTSVFDLEHTRHRSPVNAMAHMLAALTAYCFYDSKPSVFLPENQHLLQQKQNPLAD